MSKHESGLTVEQRAIIHYHLTRIISICATELERFDTQGADGFRETMECIEDNTTAIISTIEDADA